MKKFITVVSGLVTGCTPFYAEAWNPLNGVMTEITKAIGGASFIAGAIMGAGFLLAIWFIARWIKQHFKLALLLCAVAAAIGLLLIGIKM